MKQSSTNELDSTLLVAMTIGQLRDLMRRELKAIVAGPANSPATGVKRYKVVFQNGPGSYQPLTFRRFCRSAKRILLRLGFIRWSSWRSIRACVKENCSVLNGKGLISTEARSTSYKPKQWQWKTIGINADALEALTGFSQTYTAITCLCGPGAIWSARQPSTMPSNAPARPQESKIFISMTFGIRLPRILSWLALIC
jgi:hypothetical protein